jgi:hypothetical protein
VLVLDADLALRTEGLDAGLITFPVARPLAGAMVRAGGRRLGTTDALGLVVSPASAQIGSVEVWLAGWTVFSVQGYPDHEPGSGAVLALMVREGSSRGAR